MKSSKKKIIKEVGLVSTSIGGLGASISFLGICACYLVPVFSVLGVAMIIVAFLSKYTVPFLVIGVGLLILSFFLHKNKKTRKKGRVNK